MSSKTPLVNEFAYIEQRLKEIEAEKLEALNNSKLPEDPWKPAPGYADYYAANPMGDYVC